LKIFFTGELSSFDRFSIESAAHDVEDEQKISKSSQKNTVSGL